MEPPAALYPVMSVSLSNEGTPGKQGTEPDVTRILVLGQRQVKTHLSHLEDHEAEDEEDGVHGIAGQRQAVGLMTVRLMKAIVRPTMQRKRNVSASV